MSAFGSGGVGVEPLPYDAFQRVRVSLPDSLFEADFRYSLNPLFFTPVVASSGTVVHVPLESSALLSTIAAVGSSAILQSAGHFRYLPGKSQLAVMTFVFGAGVAGVVKRVGYFDADDGIFLEQNGTTDVAVVRRTSTSGAPVDNRVVQASWNLDRLDGTGPSGITLNLAMGQILVIDLQWLGMGRVRIGFSIDGEIVYVHQFLNANVLAVPYMQTASLPVRWEIAGNGVASMTATCAAVSSEGGAELNQGVLRSASTDLTARTFTAGTPLPVIAIRPAALFGGKANRVQQQVSAIGLLAVSGAGDYRWQLIFGTGLVVGGAWGAVDVFSSAEVNRTGTSVSLTNAVVVDSGHDNAGAATRFQQRFDSMAVSRLLWCVDPAGLQREMAIVLTEVAGSTDIHASMQWRELR